MADYRREMADLENEREAFAPDQVLERYGGPQGDEDEGSDEKRKRQEREQKKAEVRKRLEEAGRAKKAKKGFLTPERKKKLRKLLMLKAAEDLKQQQLVKEQERNRILQERIIPLPDIESVTDQAKLEGIAGKFLDRIMQLEGEKYDLEYNVRQKDFEINELTIAVNDLRGKFVKPTLKKVSKYDNKFKKFQQQHETTKAVDFRANLKQTDKQKADKTKELLENAGKKSGPEWAKGGAAKEEGDEPDTPKAPKPKPPKPAEEAAEEPEAEEEEEEEGVRGGEDVETAQTIKLG